MNCRFCMKEVSDNFKLKGHNICDYCNFRLYKSKLNRWKFSKIIKRKRTIRKILTYESLSEPVITHLVNTYQQTHP